MNYTSKDINNAFKAGLERGIYITRLIKRDNPFQDYPEEEIPLDAEKYLSKLKSD